MDLMPLPEKTGPEKRREKSVPNPLLGFPRDHRCICGAKRRYASCHLKKMQNYMKDSEAKNVKTHWDAFLDGKAVIDFQTGKIVERKALLAPPR